MDQKDMNTKLSEPDEADARRHSGTSLCPHGLPRHDACICYLHADANPEFCVAIAFRDSLPAGLAQ